MPATDGQRDVKCVVKEGIDSLARRRADGEFVWLNLVEATNQQIASAGEQLGLHPLTVEDLQEFDQRAKVETYEEYVYVVAFGATLDPSDPDRIVEVHIVYSPDYLVTVAAEASRELLALHDRAEANGLRGHEVLHAVLDSLVDSFGPFFDQLDDEIGHLEERVIDRDLRGRELDIHDLRRRLTRVNRTVHRQSEAFTRLPEALRRMPDHDPAEVPYFRDVQDHLIRVSEAADTMRDRIAGLFELYLAALDNRQNVIMKQFTVIAGIFLPLSVVTGFFGMNFGWLVQHIDSQSAFWLLGVAVPAAIFAVLVAVIKWRGLFEE